MGLAELLLVNLCLNVTCPGDDVYVGGPSYVRKQYLQQLAKELKGQHLTITTLQNPPLSYTEYENNKLVGKGIAFEFIKFFQKKYGFTYSILLPDDDLIGNAEKGIFGLLSKNNADISAAFLPVLPKAWSYIHFSTNLDIGEWYVMMRRPKESATGSGLLAPFTTSVWVLILLSLLVVGPLIHFIILLRARLCKDDESKIFPLPSCVWFVYGALLKQGTTLSPTTDSSRLLFATWWIFITILTAYYTANLTAFLTLSRFTLQVNEKKDIASKHYQWVARKGHAIEALTNPHIESYDNEIGSILPYRLAKYVKDNDTDILEKDVNRKDIMLIREQPIVDYLMYRDYLAKTRDDVEEESRCTFVVTTFTVLQIARAFAYSMNFKYRPLFDSGLQYIVESGILKFMVRDKLPDTKICPHDLGSTERRLKNADLFMTYLIVGGGFTISGIVFFIEIFYEWYQKNKKAPEYRSRTSARVTNNILNVFSNKSFDNDTFKLPPPPPYHALFQPPFAYSEGTVKKHINGRDYWVVKSLEGGTTLVPLRTPSALLFHLKHY